MIGAAPCALLQVLRGPVRNGGVVRPLNSVVRRHMVFALATDDGWLRAFPGAREAEAYCEGIDVEEGGWLFFAEDGSPLEARFERPSSRGRVVVTSGPYTLQRALSGLWLQERLAQVKAVEGAGLKTIADLVELLKVNRGKRASPGGKRG